MDHILQFQRSARNGRADGRIDRGPSILDPGRLSFADPVPHDLATHYYTLHPRGFLEGVMLSSCNIASSI